MKMKWSKIIIVYSIISLLFAFSFSLLHTSQRELRHPTARVRRDAPEIFEQSREHLEVLRTGGFGERNVWADIHPHGLGISFGFSERGGRIAYEGWHTIEWLSDEEKYALVFLLTSEEMSINFISITSRRQGEKSGLVARLYHQYVDGRSPFGTSDIVEIWHGSLTPQAFNHSTLGRVLPIYLGYGYTLVSSRIEHY